MLGYFGNYDVVVVGAGVTGIMAAIAAARGGSSVLLVESGSALGGNLTAGRQTKPTGHVVGGIYRELIERVAARGAADPHGHQAAYGADGGIFDPEEMQRVIIEALDTEKVDVLLHARVIETIVSSSGEVKGIEVGVKRGRRLIMARTVVDASGDGDVAALAGAQFHIGRESDHKTQPMSAYVRLLGVDLLRFVDYVHSHRDDFQQVTEPPGNPRDVSEYVLRFMAIGLSKRIAQARAEGFDWIVPKDHITVKAGLFPDEVNLNITRVFGDALDERDLSRAEIEVRRQGYSVFEFLRHYVPGFEKSRMLEVAPRLGVRESRRIVCDYVLTGEDVTHEARFPDAIGLCNSPVDIHDPDGQGAIMLTTGAGYGIPFRCMLPVGLDGILVAGRCASVDHIAFGSTRNQPACATMGEAAGSAASIAARQGTSVRGVLIADVQSVLSSRGVQLGAADVVTRSQEATTAKQNVKLGATSAAM